MSSVWGNKIKISLFGESHGEAIGVVINNLPPGIQLNFDYIKEQMNRRKPGRKEISTSRIEGDEYQILSGYFEGRTTGSPLCAIIYNENAKSKDYSILKDKMRPGHSDYPAFIKYQGFNDYRGGGHFSGRITAPLLFAGAIAMQLLEGKDIYIGSRIKSIFNIEDNGIRGIDKNLLDRLKGMEFPVINSEKSKEMKNTILHAKEKGNSVGGIVETYILNLGAGYGEPFFDSVESRLSHMIFSIPAVKGIEFGLGFDITRIYGSQAKDEYVIQDDKIYTKSNNNGGILGGITNGMPIVFRTAIKPTPSIYLEQETINIKDRKNVSLQIQGRHDPCIVPRVLPVIEGAAALVVLDLILEREGELWIE